MGLPLRGMLAIATGVFREIDNVDLVADRVKAETGLRIRVISGEDEAKLMAKDFAAHTAEGSTFLFDLGGATMEWAWFDAGETKQCGSVPLGAIRNEYAFKRLRSDHERYLSESAAFCDERLASLPPVGAATVVGTGGTVKAATRCAGRDTVPVETLCGLLDQVLRVGPPQHLKPSRQVVFLPGLVILWRILKRCQAPHLAYGKASVRDGMAGRLVRLLGTYRRQDLHATLLLNTRQLRRNIESQ
jgi:exopolyphosphatase/pppGpp-phosphohydrolase